MLTKYTALLLLPIFAVLAALLLWRGRERIPPAALVGVLAVALGTAVFVVGLGYGSRFRPDLFAKGVLEIYPDRAENYLYYLLGRVAKEPFWYHAIVSLVLKTPVSALALMALAAFQAYRLSREARGVVRLGFLLVPPAVVLLASCFDITNPGVRRVLPAIPFLLLFAAHAARGTATRWLVAALLGVSLVDAIRTYPHHLSYVNAAAGGIDAGPYLFDDSNIDWGQDLPALAAWQKENMPSGAQIPTTSAPPYRRPTESYTSPSAPPRPADASPLAPTPSARTTSCTCASSRWRTAPTRTGSRSTSRSPARAARSTSIASASPPPTIRAPGPAGARTRGGIGR